MQIPHFATELCALEGQKVNLTVAQVAEVLKCADKLLEGKLYKAIRELEEDDFSSPAPDETDSD